MFDRNPVDTHGHYHEHDDLTPASFPLDSPLASTIKAILSSRAAIALVALFRTVSSSSNTAASSLLHRIQSPRALHPWFENP